jgi:hypothetical protein
MKRMEIVVVVGMITTIVFSQTVDNAPRIIGFRVGDTVQVDFEGHSNNYYQVRQGNISLERSRWSPIGNPVRVTNSGSTTVEALNTQSVRDLSDAPGGGAIPVQSYYDV